MKNKKLLGAFAIFSIALLSVGMVSAFGFGQGTMQGKSQGMGLMMGYEDLSEGEIAEIQVFQDSIKTAIENSDFEEWKSLIESQLTQEHFNQIVEKHSKMSEQRQLYEQMQEAWENEDYETMKNLREQMSENMPGKSQVKEKCQSMGEGECEGKFMRGEKKGFFNKFRFW